MQARNQNTGEFSERINRLAEKLGIPLRGIGEKVGISTAMLFAYRSGKNPISVKAWRKLEHAESAAGLSKPLPILRIPHHGTGHTDILITEDRAAPGTPDSLRNEIRKLVEAAITAAGDDVGELGWLRGQAIRHLSADESDSPAKVIERLREEEDRKDAEALRNLERDQSARSTHGKAS